VGPAPFLQGRFTLASSIPFLGPELPGKPIPIAQAPVAGLEIGDGEQRVLLILQRHEMTNLPEVAVIFETEVEIPIELMHEADGGREGRRTVLTRCKNRRLD
jgi:hypothetical protein